MTPSVAMTVSSSVWMTGSWLFCRLTVGHLGGGLSLVAATVSRCIAICLGQLLLPHGGVRTT